MKLAITFDQIEKLDASKMPKDTQLKAGEARTTFNRWPSMIYRQSDLFSMRSIASSSFTGFSAELRSEINYMMDNLWKNPGFIAVKDLNSKLDALTTIASTIYSQSNSIIKNPSSNAQSWSALNRDFDNLSVNMAGIENMLKAYNSVHDPVSTWLEKHFLSNM